jgi:riboflavin synthase
MFTGIVKGMFLIASVENENVLHYSVSLPDDLLEGLEIGASVSVNGVCQTVVKIQDQSVYFDAIGETLKRSTLESLEKGDFVNIERSLRMGDEIGGHLLSGHVIATAEVTKFIEAKSETVVRFRLEKKWMKYLFSKGYIAIDGVSLTLVDVDEDHGSFTVHLIPETLRMTTLGKKSEGDRVNIEIDSQTQAIVDTVERIQKKHS